VQRVLNPVNALLSLGALKLLVSNRKNIWPINNLCHSSPVSFLEQAQQDKNLSGDETANVNFYAVRPEATRIHRNNAK